ncbi:hypothetical protein H0H92_006909 [Tricholoma furcatifolium]|nr:hypothetical protein H0H92_006909 [Tricholoma furcatifolium]
MLSLRNTLFVQETGETKLVHLTPHISAPSSFLPWANLQPESSKPLDPCFVQKDHMYFGIYPKQTLTIGVEHSAGQCYDHARTIKRVAATLDGLSPFKIIGLFPRKKAELDILPLNECFSSLGCYMHFLVSHLVDTSFLHEIKLYLPKDIELQYDPNASPPIPSTALVHLRHLKFAGHSTQLLSTFLPLSPVLLENLETIELDCNIAIDDCTYILYHVKQVKKITIRMIKRSSQIRATTATTTVSKSNSRMDSEFDGQTTHSHSSSPVGFESPVSHFQRTSSTSSPVDVVESQVSYSPPVTPGAGFESPLLNAHWQEISPHFFLAGEGVSLSEQQTLADGTGSQYPSLRGLHPASDSQLRYSLRSIGQEIPPAVFTPSLAQSLASPPAINLSAPASPAPPPNIVSVQCSRNAVTGAIQISMIQNASEANIQASTNLIQSLRVHDPGRQFTLQATLDAEEAAWNEINLSNLVATMNSVTENDRYHRRCDEVNVMLPTEGAIPPSTATVHNPPLVRAQRMAYRGHRNQLSIFLTPDSMYLHIRDLVLDCDLYIMDFVRILGAGSNWLKRLRYAL